jgi:hypothetical protein
MGKTTSKSKQLVKEVGKSVDFAEPKMSEGLTVDIASTRRNSSATNIRTDQYKTIIDSPFPYASKNRIGGMGATISISNTVELVQRAYFNFPVLRNVVDVMTEFSCGKIHFKGGSEKSRSFFRAYTKKLNLWHFNDMFFREYYKTGNVFIFRVVGKMDDDDISNIKKMFGATDSPFSSYKIPVRYIILNAADVESGGGASFLSARYFKILNEYEIQRLKNPTSEEDKEVLKALPEEIKTQIKQSKDGYGSGQVLVPLDPKNLRSVFYKKQDYEPFGAPMAWPVLKDLAAKEEMKQIDMAIARTMQQMMLLVTAGAEPDKGGINKAYISSLNELFKNQSVGRVLVADYTTKAQFVIPDIAQILTPEKYQILDTDINVGLNNIFVGGEKFANQSAKVEVFIERLRHGREAYINNFLQPEIKSICDEMGFRDVPCAEFEDFDMQDQGLMTKLYVELAKIGYLTPQETFNAINTGELPDDETSYKNQVEHKDRKDKGYYEPQIGAKKDETGALAGRPSGSGGKKTINPMTPMGGSIYGVKQIKENFVLASRLEEEVAKLYKDNNKIRKLTAADELIIDQISKTIIANENPSKWIESVAKYSENPSDTNQERLKEIYEIAAEHGVDFFLASMLRASRKD